MPRSENAVLGEVLPWRTYLEVGPVAFYSFSAGSAVVGDDATLQRGEVDIAMSAISRT